MSQPASGATGLIRVTVASPTRRVDLVLPGAVPIAELVPELARSVGLLDPSTVYGGYRMRTHDGRDLVADVGLVAQGVDDGGLVTISAGIDEEPPKVYDDIVEAMADVVEGDLKPWQPAAGRRTALWAAGLLLAVGAAALLLQRGGTLPAVAAGVIATLLCLGAVVLSRAQDEESAAVAVAWMGAGYGAATGWLLAPAGDPFGYGLAFTGAGAMIAGLLTILGLDAGRALSIPPVVAGGIATTGGLLLAWTTLDPATVLVALLVLVVIFGSVFPWLALSSTGTDVDQIFSVADITADPDPIAADDVARDARTAHEILIAVTATVGLLLVLVAPVAVGLGVAGTLLALCCCLVVVLRTRQYRTGATVLVGLTSGIAGMVSTAVAVLWLHPEWRPVTAVVLAVAGGLLLAATLLPSSGSVRRGRLGDIAETLALLALLPLLILAIGVFAAIRS
ncbi:type VII secretion integral membrane protein EccD [Nocardioides limicola]|uniref:type VII secretion integral membrane protein EccD n=1 Tax=Nocardioides limicola TaxID=2803368 RepID=UPI00193C0458|nr:type VII secretion integral membrane protein EccD [Nocardioides sp. DJM-14]